MAVMHRCSDLTRSPKGFLRCILPEGHESDPLSFHHIDPSGPVEIGSPWNLIGEHPADRLMGAQAISSDSYLNGDPAPTKNQVAAVLHALADFTHNKHMLEEKVAALGYDDTQIFGPAWGQATGLGRYFHTLGDYLNNQAREEKN